MNNGSNLINNFKSLLKIGFCYEHTKKVSGTALAMVAAGLFTLGSQVAVSAEADQVQCWGVNSCKGHNDCATASNACKGHGSCKGHGYLNMSAKECEAKGGTVKDAK